MCTQNLLCWLIMAWLIFVGLFAFNVYVRSGCIIVLLCLLRVSNIDCWVCQLWKSISQVKVIPLIITIIACFSQPWHVLRSLCCLVVNLTASCCPDLIFLQSHHSYFTDSFLDEAAVSGSGEYSFGPKPFGSIISNVHRRRGHQMVYVLCTIFEETCSWRFSMIIGLNSTRRAGSH